MENASRALVMAGGILIALMILGALMLMLNNLSSYQTQNDDSKKASQIAEFNNQFEPYNKKDLTLMELKSVYNKIESNNVKNSENQIAHNINGIYENIGNDFKELPEDDKQNRVFECKNIEYNGKDGRISKIEFKQVK